VPREYKGEDMSEENKKTYHWDSGKGSRPRSYSVSQEEFGKKWDAIFGKKEPEIESLQVDKLSDIGSVDVGTISFGLLNIADCDFKIDSEGNITKNPVAAVSSEGQKPDVG
jgi:hypothetical protein